MAEVQLHGNQFEDVLIQQITGLTKKEYEKKISGGYTSPLDLHEGILCSFNGSVKSTGGDGVGCGDILRFMGHCQNTPFKFIVAQWNQVDSQHKVFERVYEFDFTPEVYNKLFGDLTLDVITPFVQYVKSIPEGKAAQLANRSIWKQKRKDIQTAYNTGLISIDAKIDSKSQRRVQCGVKISNLINAGINYSVFTDNYQGIDLPYVIYSRPRTFKKSIG